MKLSTNALRQLVEQSEVTVGNVYPAKGGKGGTEYWLVVALSPTGAHLIGFDKDGLPCSTASYLRGAMRERPIIGKVDLSAVTLDV
jgi:hypothetical protein